jgi:excisionase family DNA binding protein
MLTDNLGMRIKRASVGVKTEPQLSNTTKYLSLLRAYRCWYQTRSRHQTALTPTNETAPAPEMTSDGLHWADGSYTVRGIGQALGVPKSTVHRWLNQGRIEGTHRGPGRLWRIQLTDEQIHALRGQVSRATRTPFIRRRNDNGA